MKNNIKSIQVFGSGCPSCKKLYERTREAASGLDLGVEVEYVTDIQKIIDMGMLSNPVLVINDEPVSVGRMLDVTKIKELISEAANK